MNLLGFLTLDLMENLNIFHILWTNMNIWNMKRPISFRFFWGKLQCIVECLKKASSLQANKHKCFVSVLANFQLLVGNSLSSGNLRKSLATLTLHFMENVNIYFWQKYMNLF